MGVKCTCEHCDLRSLFFGHVNESILNKVCEMRIEREFQKYESIISEGQSIEHFIYLKKGLVKLYRLADDGKSQIIAIGKPLDFVSLLSVFSDPAYKYSVAALEPSVTCEIPVSIIRDLVLVNGTFAMGMIQKISKTTDAVILDFLDIRRKHLRGRVAHVLLFFTDSIYHSLEFEIPVSRKEIAEIIGMTSENVIRTLSEFKKDNLLKINGKQIQIVDKDRLQAISQHG